MPMCYFLCDLCAYYGAFFVFGLNCLITNEGLNLNKKADILSSFFSFVP